jgi:hypothetical protein
MQPFHTLAAFVLLALPALAQVTVYDQPLAPNGGVQRPSQLWIDPAGLNDYDTDAIVYEDVTPTQDVTISRVRFVGEPAPSLGFELRFFHQDPGTIAVQPDMFRPGSGPFAQGIYTTFAQSPASGGLSQIEVTLAAPLTFAANVRTFVAVIGRTPIAGAVWRWAQGNGGANGCFYWQRGASAQYVHLGDDRALALVSDFVPQAGTPFCFGDGSGTACPCGNASLPGVNEGCASSLGYGGKLAATGIASLANDGVVLSATQMPNSSSLYFQGTAREAGGLGSVVGDGLLCTGGALLRLRAKPNAAGASRFPDAGDPVLSLRGGITAPGTYTYQAWYRNAAAFCTPATFGLTNAVEIAWTP